MAATRTVNNGKDARAVTLNALSHDEERLVYRVEASGPRAAFQLVDKETDEILLDSSSQPPGNVYVRQWPNVIELQHITPGDDIGHVLVMSFAEAASYRLVVELRDGAGNLLEVLKDVTWSSREPAATCFETFIVSIPGWSSTSYGVGGVSGARLPEVGGDEAPPPDKSSKAETDATRASTIADVVACTVFAPPAVGPGSTFMVQVVAHLPEDAQAAAALAVEADEDAEKRGSKSLDAEVARGSRLTFHLRVPGMEVDDPVQHLVWRGEPEAVQFGVSVVATQAPGNVIGTVTVSQDGVPFGSVKFKLKVAGAPAPNAPVPTGDARPAEQSWARYRKAFISYASKDRDEVLKRVQMLARLKIEFFQDLLSLEPGERWERALYRHIDESDVFFLFWSTAARDSEWVLREIRYALGRRGGDELKPPEIVPVIIEGPPLVKPPPELDDLHFNDQILYFINRQGGAQ